MVASSNHLRRRLPSQDDSLLCELSFPSGFTNRGLRFVSVIPGGIRKPGHSELALVGQESSATPALIIPSGPSIGYVLAEIP